MIRTEEIASGRIDGHIAHAEQPRGGVLVLPTVTGVDAPMRERARILAEAGYTAFVWNPYPGQKLPADLESARALAVTLNDGTLDSMSECLTHLLDKLRIASVGVLGFCLGGRYAVLLAARDKRLQACVAYYPSIRVPKQPNQSLDAIALAAEIRCPVHLVHGTADQVFLHAVFLQLRDVLDRRDAPTVTQIHPDAVHSFMRPDLHSVPANATAARLSWPPALAFLATCLAQAG